MTEIIVQRLLVDDRIAEDLAQAGLVEAHVARDHVVLRFPPGAPVDGVLDVLARSGSKALSVKATKEAKARRRSAV